MSEPGEKAAAEAFPVKPEVWQLLETLHLDVPVQLSFLVRLFRDMVAFSGQSSLTVEEDMRGVSGEGLGMNVLKGFEVIVDGMPHHYLPCENLQDLKQTRKRRW